MSQSPYDARGHERLRRDNGRYNRPRGLDLDPEDFKCVMEASQRQALDLLPIFSWGTEWKRPRQIYVACTQDSRQRPIRPSLFGAFEGAPSVARRGWAPSRSPGGKRGAQASAMKAPMRETPSKASCTARQRDRQGRGRTEKSRTRNPASCKRAEPPGRFHASTPKRRCANA